MMWETIPVIQATDGNIIWRMCFLCWINMTTDTHLSYFIVTAFPRQQWLSERASILRYMYTGSLVLRILCQPTNWIYSSPTAKWQATNFLNIGSLKVIYRVQSNGIYPYIILVKSRPSYFTPEDPIPRCPCFQTQSMRLSFAFKDNFGDWSKLILKWILQQQKNNTRIYKLDLLVNSNKSTN